MVSLPPSATPTLVTQQMTFVSPALVTPSVDLQPTQSEVLASERPPSPPPPVSETVQELPTVSLTFLLPSGKRKTLSFEASLPISKVRQHLFDDWPEEWAEEPKPPEPNAIRLLQAGRFLDDTETLSNDKKFPPPPATPAVVHLTVRPFPARQSSQDKRSSFLRQASGFSMRGGNNTRGETARDHAITEENPTSQQTGERRGGGCGCIIC